MRHPALLAVLIAGCALAAWAADTDGDGLPDDVEAALGSDISTPDRMTPVYEDGAKGEGDETVGADLEVAHDLLAVHFASLARGRTLWRLQFTEPWVVRGDVALIIYIDADNDKETGRQGGGHRGTDVMLRPRSASNHGLPATVLQASAAHGDSLYLTLDAPVNVEDGEVAMRAYVLIQNRENPADSDRTPWFEVRAPASDAEPVAVPESHSLYRAPEVIERIRVRVPMDEGGRRAIVTWITTWPTEAVVQYGRGSTFDAAVRHEQPEQNHRVVLEDLDPHSTYRCRIRCRSGTGEMISSDEVQFSTEFEEPDGSVARHRVPLRVVGAPGEARPVSQGVPFPRGALGSADHARVLDDAGAEVPSQVNVTSRWPDDTVKWLLLDFQADIPEGGEARYALEFGTEVTRAEVPDPLAVTATEEAMTVDTGALKVRFDRANFALLGEAWLGDERITDVEGAGIVLTDLDGERFTSLGPPDELFVSRRGPLHAVVTARGPHRSEGGEALFRYEVRAHFYAGLPMVRVFHTFENDRNEAIDSISIHRETDLQLDTR